MYWRLDRAERLRNEDPEELEVPCDLVQRTLERVFSDLHRPDEQAWLRDIERRRGRLQDDIL